MRRIYLTEDKINVIKERVISKLPSFLYKALSSHKTSLGNNAVFPSDDIYPFDYIIAKKRFNEVSDTLQKYGYDINDINVLSDKAIKCLLKIRDLEEPLHNHLEKVCHNIVCDLFSIPKNSINFSLNIVDKVASENARLTPEEDDEDNKYEFEDVLEKDEIDNEISKRRVIDSLIQGTSIRLSNLSFISDDYFDNIDEELITLYKELMDLGDYLAFVKNDKIIDGNTNQGSYVSVKLGGKSERPIITVQALNFPLLLRETIRGVFELVSSHGLPKDRKKANYILRKADFIKAEPWDMRLGVGLWDRLYSLMNGYDTDVVPFIFMKLCENTPDEFNKIMKEILTPTKLGGRYINDLANSVLHNIDYQRFKKDIDTKQSDIYVINDSYFSPAELDTFNIDSEENESGVIEDNKEL